MRDILIVAVNRQQARFFVLKRAEQSGLEPGSPMAELQAFINPEAMADSQQLYSDSKTGRGTAPRGGPVHGYDDRRDQHLDEVRRRFAVRVLAEIRRLAQAERLRIIIVASSARMRRFLYPELEALGHQGCEIHKVSKNMITLSAHKVHAQLADLGLVPIRTRLSLRPRKSRITPIASRRAPLI
jgi:hypothetical protein